MVISAEKNSKWTVLGATGFIGSAMVNHVSQKGYDVFAPDRTVDVTTIESLGNVIYCIGLTGDFRYRPFETVEAHVTVLSTILKANNFDSFLYLSSTRVYTRNQDTTETDAVTVCTTEPSDLYNISKLLGESLCFTAGHPKVRVSRLSNILSRNDSDGSFVHSLIQEAVQTHRINFQTSLDSQKDYLLIEDVAPLLESISLHGQHRLYNAASGVNISHRRLVDLIQSELGVDVSLTAGKETVEFPRINIKRISDEFGFSPTPTEPVISAIVQAKVNELKSTAEASS